MNMSMKQKQTHDIEKRVVVANGVCGKEDWKLRISRCKL